MVIIPAFLPLDHQIVISGDWHEGSLLQEPKVLHAVRDEVLSIPNTFLAHPGDWAEGILIDDPRYDPTTQKQWTPLNQYQAVKDFIEPMSRRILVACFGNHDFRLFKYGNMVRDYLCRELGIPYGTFVCKLVIKDKKGRLQYKHYLTHGKKQINSAADDPIRVQANMELILKRHLKNKAADCLVMVKGHTHKLLAVKPRQDLYLYDDEKQIKSAYRVSEPGTTFIHPDLRYYGNSGSAYRLFADPGDAVSSYGELAEYDPVELGYLRLTVRGGKVVDFRKVEVA